jgi:hypothetical protein
MGIIKDAFNSVTKKPEMKPQMDIEQRIVSKVGLDQQSAEGGSRKDAMTDIDDEEKIYIGEQWDTSRGKRSYEGKKRNFNSQDNLVLPTIENIAASLTSSSPTIETDPMEPSDAEVTALISDFIPAIMERNKFQKTLRKMTKQFVKHGPLLGMVDWDGSWIGGKGANRWVGEISIKHINVREWYPDPAIMDLETDLQLCSFINQKFPMKISAIEERWPETGMGLSAESTAGAEKGMDPDESDIIVSWHTGTPDYVPDESKKRFAELADKAESAGFTYEAQDYRDMAKGELKGIHVAYVTQDRLLEYIPYRFDHGKYPFVVRTMYAQEKRPLGMGEIRNLIIPQILHNFADEVELGAMSVEGLGGARYQKGAITPSQLNTILMNNSKPGAWMEVQDINLIQDRTGPKVPASITNYKEHKQRIIDTVSQNTAIQQGISPGANVPYATVEALGARADVRTKSKIEIMEDFLKELFTLIVEVAGQFYTERRMFRITGEKQEQAKASQVYGVLKQIGNMPPGTPPDLQMQALIEVLTIIKTAEPRKTFEIGRADLMRSWTRDTVSSEAGVVEQQEEFIPEYDMTVKVGDERPTDRNYYTNIAMSLLGKGMGMKAFWKTLDEGKFPPVDEILQELDQQAQAAQQQQMAQQKSQLMQTQQPIPGR